MSVLQDGSVESDNLARRAMSHSIARRAAIVSLLSLQSRKTESPEAAKRAGAFGRGHRRLHRLELLDTVELKQYLAQLCQDISEILFAGEAPRPVVVDGAQIEIPTRLGVPLGFIVNELVTNAAEHANGKITVRVETSPELGHCLSVSDGGPGLPEGFRPGSSKGLGLRIVQSLVRQINGRLQVGRGTDQEGACLKVFFPSAAAT
jgi:two-component system, sensor histidine kinase PdtaS